MYVIWQGVCLCVSLGGGGGVPDEPGGVCYDSKDEGLHGR